MLHAAGKASGRRLAGGIGGVKDGVAAAFLREVAQTSGRCRERGPGTGPSERIRAGGDRR